MIMKRVVRFAVTPRGDPRRSAASGNLASLRIIQNKKKNSAENRSENVDSGSLTESGKNGKKIELQKWRGHVVPWGTKHFPTKRSEIDKVLYSVKIGNFGGLLPNRTVIPPADYYQLLLERRLKTKPDAPQPQPKKETYYDDEDY